MLPAGGGTEVEENEDDSTITASGALPYGYYK